MAPVLRSGLLEGRAVALAPGRVEALAGALAGLGARVEGLALPEGFGEDEEQVGEWARERAPLHALVYDARDPAAGTSPVWAAVREVAAGALIPGPHPGKVVLIGPRPDAGPGAGELRSALENLARTLSVEWARYGVTVVMVAPGARSGDEEVVQLICFLCSRAGEYFSGCRLEMR
jgi:hypothetical protein